MPDWRTKFRTYLAEHAPNPSMRRWAKWATQNDEPLCYEEAVAYYTQTNERMTEAELHSFLLEVDSIIDGPIDPDTAL